MTLKKNNKFWQQFGCDWAKIGYPPLVPLHLRWCMPSLGGRTFLALSTSRQQQITSHGGKLRQSKLRSLNAITDRRSWACPQRPPAPLMWGHPCVPTTWFWTALSPCRTDRLSHTLTSNISVTKSVLGIQALLSIWSQTTTPTLQVWETSCSHRPLANSWINWH